MSPSDDSSSTAPAAAAVPSGGTTASGTVEGEPSVGCTTGTRGAFIPELGEALQSIKGVVTAFEKDLRTDVKWDWKRDRVSNALVNLLVLNTVHERAASLQGPPKAGWKANLLASDEAVGKEAARYMRFASAAYGILMLKGANVMSWDSGWPPVHKFSVLELNKWCITKHCGIQDADLVKMNTLGERELHMPAYVLTVDHATESVVLSVRGTFSMQDTVTDLVCDSTDFMGGSCHRGLRQGAEMLLADAKSDVLEQLNRHRGYRLVVTGHSLGGGVSILLTMMLLRRRSELGLGSTRVLCYAFAPPPVFGPLEKLTGEMQRAIRSFVFGNDMVCRMSLASAYELFRDLKEVEGIGASLPLRLGYLVNEHRPRLSIHDDGLGDVGMRVAYRYATILHRTRSRGGNSKRGGYRSSQRGGGGRRGAGATSGHPVEDFVQSKLAEEFTETGAARGAHRKRDRGGGVGLRTASEDAWRTGRERDVFKTSSKRGGGSEADGGSGDRYTRLLIPGTIYHIRKLGAESAAASSASVCSEKPLGLRSKLYWMERQQPEEFARLLMVDTAIVDHLPLAYEEALHALYGDGLPRR